MDVEGHVDPFEVPGLTLRFFLWQFVLFYHQRIWWDHFCKSYIWPFLTKIIYKKKKFVCATPPTF